MCFYIGLPETIVKISERYKRPFKAPEQFTPSERFNGFTHPITPIIANDHPDIIEMASWGLLPHWSSDLKFRNNTLNARIETVEMLPSFRDSSAKRCLIPASRFYEWRHEDIKKIPYMIVSQETELFSFAGIYNDWTDVTNQTVIRTYSILTTAANETIQYINNIKKRMPVILKLADEEKWLAGAAIQQFAFPYSTNLIGMVL